MRAAGVLAKGRMFDMPELQIIQALIFRGFSQYFQDLFRVGFSNGHLHLHANGYMITHPLTYKLASLETMNRQR